MHFASDNTAGASAKVLDAIVRANAGRMPSYGADIHTREAERLIGEAFGCEPAVVLVATGTAANALALGALVPAGGVVFCHEGAHIIEEECAAPEFFTGAGKLVGLAGAAGKIDPAAFRAMLRRYPRGVVRQAQPACLSLSQATEAGTLYRPEEIRTLADIAHEAGLVVHMDGARFVNAVVSLDCTPADISSAAGVDVLSFGATKNGTLACEAVIVFDKAEAARLPFMQKRGGHVLSKGRLLGAQMAAYLEGGHWLSLARHANAMARRLADGLAALPGVRVPWPCEANEVFPVLPRSLADAMKAGGAVFHDWEPAYLGAAERPAAGAVFTRFVCAYATEAAEVDALVALARASI